MQTYTVTFKGRATKSATGETSRDFRVVEGWDRGDARRAAEQLAGRSMVLAGVRCDEVEVVNIARGARR